MSLRLPASVSAPHAGIYSSAYDVRLPVWTYIHAM